MYTFYEDGLEVKKKIREKIELYNNKVKVVIDKFCKYIDIKTKKHTIQTIASVCLLPAAPKIINFFG